jgi:hypothetical protein
LTYIFSNRLKSNKFAKNQIILIVMRVGLFIGDIESKELISSLTETFHNEIVGYSSPVPMPSILNDLKFQPYPLELLSGCDVALVFDKKSYFESIPIAAIKRGIHVYIHYQNFISVNKLIELKALLQEINVRVGFGFSGQNLNNYLADKSLLSSPFFMDYKVGISKKLKNNQHKDQLLCDIATILRLNLGSIRRVRSIAYPSSSLDYNLVNIRFEYPNGSIINYTLSRIEPSDKVSINLYGGQIEVPVCFEFDKSSLFHTQTQEIWAPEEFLRSIQNSTSFGFSVDEAIAVQQIKHELESKLMVV